MKIPCPTHGAHFGDEIDDIVGCPDVWIRWNLRDLPEENRRELTEWYVKIPSDKIFIETGWGVGVGLHGDYIGYENALASSTEYLNMTDEQRRDYQRDNIKQAYQANRKESLWQKLFKRR